MSRVLGNKPHQTPAERLGARSLVVHGHRYANSAAKFWSSLVDELRADYPDCDTIVLDTLTDVPLDRDLLFPENALQQEIDLQRGRMNLEEALREALAEFDLIGPPGSVHVKLFSGNVHRKSCDLPRDCVDADIFPYLLVWLLEWAEIPHCLWNNADVAGDFLASDRERRIRYRLRFELVNKHVSEGLYQRTLTLRYTRRT